jgi:hypothetical protein
MSRIFENFTRGPSNSGVENRETSVFTGALRPKPRPELQQPQPMDVKHTANKD